MSPKYPVLSVQNLSVIRSGITILNAVSWSVQPGEHWVILGANGSGKTSLLSALTGYLTPTSGEISVLGERYGESDWRELRRHVGIVSSALRQMMPDSEEALTSVASGKFAMIDYWGDVSAADRTEARRILRLVECEYLAERRWEVLSQGERQRVLIARALMAHPRVLILDEPCAGLDPVAREHFLAFIERLAHQRGAPALLFVTHHVEEITPVFTHALLLRSGYVHGAGPIATTLTSRYISEIFGERTSIFRRAGRYRLSIPKARAWSSSGARLPKSPHCRLAKQESPRPAKRARGDS